jgi:hypothetical protein
MGGVDELLLRDKGEFRAENEGITEVSAMFENPKNRK